MAQDRKPLTTKQSMFAVWLVGSLLWGSFAFYAFDLKRLPTIYLNYDKAHIKYARGRSADPLHFDYHERRYIRMNREMDDMNRKLVLFLMSALAMPGMLLALGTFLLNRSEEEKLKQELEAARQAKKNKRYTLK